MRNVRRDILAELILVGCKFEIAFKDERFSCLLNSLGVLADYAANNFDLLLKLTKSAIDYFDIPTREMLKLAT